MVVFVIIILECSFLITTQQQLLSLRSQQFIQATPQSPKLSSPTCYKEILKYKGKSNILFIRTSYGYQNPRNFLIKRSPRNLTERKYESKPLLHPSQCWHLPIHLAQTSLYLLEIPEDISINDKFQEKQDQATKGIFQIISTNQYRSQLPFQIKKAFCKGCCRHLKSTPS